MDPRLYEWLNLFVRWFHVVIGILWIGQTAFFSWLDARMRVESPEDGGPDRVWMVHSGGFYVVEKQQKPELLPRTLHWFKWEAAFSWISGIVLLALVYYAGGLVLEFDSEMSLTTAALIGFGTLAGGWWLYDLAWISPLARYERTLTTVSVLAVVAVAWLLSDLFSGRGAYIHVGALLGTVMTANVWMRILPAQRQMLAAVRAGDEPDMTLGRRAKQRSTHNTFMALPLIFIMISNHFPTTSYGHRLNWLMLAGFLGVGFLARYAMNRWNERVGDEKNGDGKSGHEKSV